MATQYAVDLVFKSQGLGKLDAATKKLQGIDGTAKRAKGSVDKLTGSMRRLGGAIAAIGAADQLRRAFGAAADFSGTQQRVKNLTQTYVQFAGIQDVAAKSARRFAISNAQALSDLTDLGSRLGGTGASLDDLRVIYEGFNTLLVNNAVGAQQAASATLQLNQALGSGRLAGEEFNAINEATPQLLDEVAKVMKVNRGQLKGLASDGLITSQVLIQALTNIRTKGADALAESLKTPAGRLRQFDAAVKDLQVSIGSELLPVITPLVIEVTKLVKAFGDLPGPIKTIGVVSATAAVGVGLLASAFGALGISLGGLAGGLLSKAAIGLATLGGGATTVATGWTAAGAAITKTTIAVNAATVSMGLFAAAIPAALVVGLGLAFKEAADKKREFDDALRSQEPEVLDSKINELTKSHDELTAALAALKATPWYRGQVGDIADIQKRIDALDKQIDQATRRRTLLVELQVVAKGIAADVQAQALAAGGVSKGFDTLTDKEIEEALGLAGITSNTPPTTGGGGAAPRESMVPALTRELALSSALLENQRQSLQAQFDGNKAAVQRLAYDRISIELAGKEAEIAAEKIPEGEKALKRAIAQNEAITQQVELQFQSLEIEKQRKEQLAQTLQPIEDEIALLQGRLDGNQQEIQDLIDIRELKKQIVALDGDPSRAEALIKQRNEMREQVKVMEEIEARSKEIASGIAGEMTGALRSIIDGTKQVDEAFADMLNGIANRFMDMAMQILQDALTKQLMQLFGSLLGGGGVSSGAFSIGQAAGFGGFFADGGTLGAGKWGIAGEAGPELITGPARIHPAGEGGAVNSVVNVNISDSGTSVDTKNAGKLGRMIESSTMAILTRERRPGGLLTR